MTLPRPDMIIEPHPLCSHKANPIEPKSAWSSMAGFPHSAFLRPSFLMLVFQAFHDLDVERANYELGWTGEINGL